jgi:hypothetical protein
LLWLSWYLLVHVLFNVVVEIFTGMIVVKVLRDNLNC